MTKLPPQTEYLINPLPDEDDNPKWRWGDVGMGMLNKTLQGEREHKFLMGSGGGVQLHFRKNIYVRAQWAKALGDKRTQGAGPSTFYITCQVEI